MVESCLVLGLNRPQPVAVVVLNPQTCASLSTQQDQIEAQFALHLDNVNQKLDRHEQIESLVLTTEPWTTANGMLTPTLKARRRQIELHYETRMEGWLIPGKKIVWSAK